MLVRHAIEHGRNLKKKYLYKIKNKIKIPKSRSSHVAESHPPLDFDRPQGRQCLPNPQIKMFKKLILICNLVNKHIKIAKDF